MKSEEKKDKVKLGSVFKYLKYSYRYAKEGRVYLFLTLFSIIILSVISVVLPIFNAKQIVSLTANEWEKLISIILIIFVIEILRNLVRLLDGVSVNKYFYTVKKNLQLAIVEETLKITTNDLNNNSSGVFIERINNDTATVVDAFVLLFDFISTLIANVGVFISVFFINKIIFSLFAVFIIVSFFVQKKAGDVILKKRKINIKNREKVNGFTSEMVRGAKDIKILNAEKSFLKHAALRMDNLNNSGMDWTITRSKFRFINGSIQDILNLTISLVGIYFIIKGELTVAAMLIIYNYSGKIRNISSTCESIINEINTFNLSASRIFGILVEEEFNKEKFGNHHVSKLKGNIRFDKVNFDYDGYNAVLKNMSFEIDANTTVAFVGKSGAGKSTVFNLISKLYDPVSGEIYLDQYNIKDLDRASIRSNLSIISQNPYIYNMSIKENLQIIKSDATVKEIKAACKAACLHDFIVSLKDGYDTIVGEGGVTLSGGQKQRLAIARAILLKTKIILFDEATSALDNETQREITRAIENMKGDYTILIIAHRLSTVENADKIFVVDNGNVVDVGTRSYLLKNSKAFKKLYQTELENEK